MVGGKDNSIQALLEKLKIGLERLDEEVNGPDKSKREAIEILRRLEFTPQEAKEMVRGIPQGLSTQAVVEMALRREGNRR